MKRTLLLAITALIAFGLIAPAANADIQGAGTLVGGAEVGRHFLDADGDPIDCTKTTAKFAFARGQGLFLPTPPQPTTNGVWSLHTTVNFVSTPARVNLGGSLDVCGWLQYVGRRDNMTAVGPACGVSKGHSGRGQVNFNPPPGGLNLFDVGWKSSAGGTLPVTGKYQVWNGTKTSGKQKKNKWGNLLAQVQAQGGLPCAQVKNCPDQKTAGPDTPGCGAQRFTVLGTFELVQADKNRNGTPGEKKDVIRPKTVPPACKDTENEECAYDDNKFGKEDPPGSKTA